MQVFNVEQIRKIERYAIEKLVISESELMYRASKYLLDVFLDRYPDKRNIVILCGKGNNAGDGYLFALLLKEKEGIECNVRILSMFSLEQLTELARIQALKCKEIGISILEYNSSLIDKENTDVIIDAIFGIGFSGIMKCEILEAIEYVNTLDIPKMAVDIPSGLDANTGLVKENAIMSDMSVTFIGKKKGMYTCDAQDYCGEIFVSDLDIDMSIGQIESNISILDYRIERKKIPNRKRNSHKGDYGHLLIIGGNSGMLGAVSIAVESAKRTGVGLISVCTKKEHFSSIASRNPESMFVEIGKIIEYIENRKISAVIIGIGLGTDAWSIDCLNIIIEYCSRNNIRILYDADALNLISNIKEFPKHLINPVFTPHPGEASRLLNQSIESIQSDRFSSNRKICEKFECISVLKGCGTLIDCENNKQYICTYGNSGMSKGGMGDSLSGIIGGLMSQTNRIRIEDAVTYGVCMHGLSGDIARDRFGEEYMSVTDLISSIQFCNSKCYHNILH